MEYVEAESSLNDLICEYQSLNGSCWCGPQAEGEESEEEVEEAE